MDIKSAQFVISNTDFNKCPAPVLPEYAFIGRSNVGKSSLINMLCVRKDMAKTSGKPGKTQLINHFLINQNWYLVDLPGYGYAQVSRDKRDNWDQFIKQYIVNRPNLMCMMVLIDARLEPQRVDLEFIHWLGENGVPFVMVFTKMDKLTKTKIASQS
jgi:GTP-binding protein